MIRIRHRTANLQSGPRLSPAAVATNAEAGFNLRDHPTVIARAAAGDIRGPVFGRRISVNWRVFLYCCVNACACTVVCAAPLTNSLPHKLPTPRSELLTCKFTNELGQAVSLNDFHGQALAITFFFSRCPIPQYCPRLARNFQEASQKLLAASNGPTNWHFLSFSFDPDFDTPAVLKAYGERYQYDPRHWSFLTGAKDKLSVLASESNVTFETDSGFYNHNFRTMIVDASGHLQMVFPTSGDLSDAIVTEILKATSPANRTVTTPPRRD
jgi:protein SCO1/2